jgi:hypothetical protein
VKRLPRYSLSAVAVAALAVPFLSGSTSATSAASSWGKAPKNVTVTWTDPDAVTAGTTTTTSTALYKFSSIVSGKPVRWNPCQAIHWKFRTTGAPTGSGAVVKDTIAKVAAATGIRFVYDGTTTATPTSAWLPKTSSGIRPVLIGWTDASHSDLLRNQPAAVLGVTRTAYFGILQGTTTLAATKAAVIALDRTNRLPLTGAVSWKTTMLHELGHAMGLDHVGNNNQLMYPVLQRDLYGLQSGDKAGLYKLGRASGCIDLGF